MNILMVHPHDLFSASEPWTIRIVSIAREFVKSGHGVKLVYFPLEWEGRRPRKLGPHIDCYPFCRRSGPHILAANTLRLSKLAAWADIVHFQKCFHQASIPSIIAALLNNKPLHYDWDDWEAKIYEISTRPGFLSCLIRNFLGALEAFIPRIVDTVSVASRRLEIECRRLGVGPDRIFEAHVGADIDRFRPDISGSAVRRRYNIGKPLVLYLGQLHGGQYAELFIRSAAKITRGSGQDAVFMIAGDGYRRRELEELSRGLRLNGSMIFTGPVPHSDVPEYIAASDICVACFEKNDVTLCKSPLKIAEYMASGKAIVTSDVGEAPRMVGQAGLITAPGDPDSLAEGILKLLRREGLRKEMASRSRLRAEEKYNWAVTAANLMRAYGKAARIKGRKGGRS
ncbi:MAG: glycosyltransferase family 4 protein [Candidatus Omnitrophica bacterium]|nr:glycosyltransferase family 4 protein [Candidatus Omnitrophota bacterium]